MVHDLDGEAVGKGCSTGGCLLWFLGGTMLGLTTISALVLLILLIISVSINAYLAWQVSGLEVTISQRRPLFPETVGATPTAGQAILGPDTQVQAATGTPTPESREMELEAQLATVGAMATQAAEARATPGSVSTPIAMITPTATLFPVAINPPPAQNDSPKILPVQSATPKVTPAQAAGAERLLAPSPTSTPPSAQPAAASDAGSAALTISKNTYNLIPIDGERDSRPAEEHGDLNLKLRDPQPIKVELAVVDVGVGVDPGGPKLSKIFKPDFVAAYTVHDWDWGCNCPGKLIEDPSVVLVGLKTTPGEPIYIPPTQQDIYEGKYYAVVLYAAEDSLTFVYARAGTVVRGYTIHYLGLKTDPNLLALYRQSQGNELPGLTLDVPVGVATDELIIAIRDNGKFLDARSKNDWWN